jgi:hypothetical protein
MKRFNYIPYKYLLIGLAFFGVLSCTKYDTPPAIARDILEDGDLGVQRRVLWINIDGAVGQIVKSNVPAHIKGMLSKSKYTFEALSDNRIMDDPDGEDATNWTTLLTGMNAVTHKVRDDSYIQDLAVDPNNPNQKVAYYSNIVGLITESYPKAKTLCITPHRNLNGNMLNNTYRTVTSTSDEEARDLVTVSLANEDMNFTLVSFTGMLEAGKSGGFTASNAEYINALNTLDGYIGDCLEAINGREGAEKEDWLVVITSGHGGAEDGSWSGASQQERNALCIFYYNHYSPVEMKGQTLYGVYFNQSNSARVVDPDQLYSAGEGRALSVEVLMRMEPRSDGSYSGNNWDRLIGKRSWGIFRKNSNAVFYMERGENGVSGIENGVQAFNNSLWHSYQLGINAPTRTTKNYVVLYDGEVKLREGANTAGYIEDRNDLQIGGTGVPTPYYIAELRIWDKMLDDRTFVENNSLLNIQPSDSQYQHLVGYWKFTPDQLINGNTFKNQIEGKPDLVFNTTPRIAEFANTLPAQRKSGNLIIENTMIVPQVMYWLNVGQPTTMDGFRFLHNFSLEEEWRQGEE